MDRTGMEIAKDVAPTVSANSLTFPWLHERVKQYAGHRLDTYLTLLEVSFRQ